MKTLKTQINLEIVNNSNLTQEVSILGVIKNQNSANNLSNQYVFDLSTETFSGITTANIRYKIIPSATIITSPSVPLKTLSIQGVVDALNTLNLGVFYSENSLIYVLSDTYNFLQIDTA